jgi:hypothetical protein
MAASSSSAADGGKATLTGEVSSFITGDGGVSEVFSSDFTSQDGGAVTVVAEQVHRRKQMYKTDKN